MNKGVIKIFKFASIYYIKIIITLQFLLNLCFLSFSNLNYFEDNEFSKQKIEDIDVDILLPIQNKIKGMVELVPNEQRFLHGLIRKYKPKKILEIGVSAGGSSILILNAIKDLKDTKLYSIDRYIKWYRNPSKQVGWFIKENFPELMDKWTFYRGKTSAEYIESVGNNIDFVFIDTFHFTPGEMLNWLDILPFIKEGAIVVFHDAFLMFEGNYKLKPVKNFSNNQLLCYIRGKLILPTYGDEIFSRNIGAIKLAKNQKRYIEQYFVALGNQWQYFPEEIDIPILRAHYKKYYGEKYAIIFDDAVNKNRHRLMENVPKI